MLEFFRAAVPVGIPVFVISAMLNVGLTSTPSEILGQLRERMFVLKMVLANFVLVPLLTFAVLRLTSFGAGFEVGLLVFGLCAGAPFLIKLTQTAEHDLQQALRLQGTPPDPSRVELAYLERDGTISVIPKDEGPRILEVSAADGVQTIRIEMR